MQSRSIPPARTASISATTAASTISTPARHTWTALNSSISAAQAQSVGASSDQQHDCAGRLSGQRHSALQRRRAGRLELDSDRRRRRRFRALRPGQSEFRLSYVRDDLGRATGFVLDQRRRHFQLPPLRARRCRPRWSPPAIRARPTIHRLQSDPAVAEHVLFGAHSVYVSNDGMATWAPPTTQCLTGGCNGGACALEDLEIAPTDNTKAYALSMETSTNLRPTPFKIFTTDQATSSSAARSPMAPNGSTRPQNCRHTCFPIRRRRPESQSARSTTASHG